LHSGLALEVMAEGDERLFNPYGILALNPEIYPDTNFKGAARLIDWITSKQAQEIIRNFTIDGQPLFIPLADSHG